MKWLKSLILILVIVLFTSYVERTEVDPWDQKWYKLYPNWYQMDQEQKDSRILIYELSKSKWKWFPELHPKPERGRPTIYPRSHFFKITYK